MQNTGKLSRKTITGILLFGIVGHIAWCIENSFLNLYVYRTIGTDLKIVSAMVAVSAVVATFATIIMGWVSDRMGNRKKLMCFGYIAWGISVMMFSVFTIKNMQEFFNVDRNRAIVFACVGMVIADSIMSFFGSASNDAAYHAWVTDNTNKNNRGRVEALLSICAVVAYLLVFVPFELGGVTPNKYYDASGASVAYPVAGGTTVLGNWTLFYCVLGGVVIAAGIIGFFLIKDVPTLKSDKSLRFKDLFYGFRPSVIKRNKYFFLILATLSISYIANNCYSNYLMIYMQHTLRCDDYIKTLGYLLPMAIIYGLSAIAGIVAGILLDKKNNKTGFILPGIIVSSVGAVMMFFFSPTFLPIGVPMLALFCMGAFIQAIGSSMIAVVCLAIIRNLTPPDKVGRFLGVKMVFCVMLPMSIGSVLSAVISSSDKYITGYDEFGNAVYTCPPVMFLLCAIIVLFAVLTLIPILKSKPECLLVPAEGVPGDQTLDEVAAGSVVKDAESGEIENYSEYEEEDHDVDE